MTNYRYRKPKSKILAGIIALFFGGFGIHKFYLREPGVGIFYIFLFFMTSKFFPVSSILGIFDAIRIFNMSDAQFDAVYNKGVIQKRPNFRGRRNKPVHRRQEKPVKRRNIPKNNPFIKSGLAKYKEFDLEGAIADFNNALNIDNDNIAVHFNLACAYSLTEQKEKGFRHLRRAVELGFKDFEKIRSHDDLAFLRIQKEFEAFEKSGFKQWSSNEKGTKEVFNEEKQMDDVLLSQLNKLSELRKKGILSEREFELERRKLLRNG